MTMSPLLERRKVPQEADLGVLGHSGPVVPASRDEDCLTEVNGTGRADTKHFYSDSVEQILLQSIIQSKGGFRGSVLLNLLRGFFAE